MHPLRVLVQNNTEHKGDRLGRDLLMSASFCFLISKNSLSPQMSLEGVDAYTKSLGEADERRQQTSVSHFAHANPVYIGLRCSECRAYGC